MECRPIRTTTVASATEYAAASATDSVSAAASATDPDLAAHLMGFDLHATSPCAPAIVSASNTSVVTYCAHPWSRMRSISRLTAQLCCACAVRGVTAH